ncbi:hypothetical protein TWF506_004644 [Arthrobotrys conoides]|uniref:Uncharacterized protein n=1 Tax=Arthrobotrys conoides TaxID=74498 RepID=A0AAN8NJ80_9PEZI
MERSAAFTALKFKTNFQQDSDWVLLGTSQVNATRDLSHFTRYWPLEFEMRTYEGRVIYGFGDVRLLVPTMNSTGGSGVALLELHRVCYIPSLLFNILGVPTIQQFGITMHTQPGRLLLDEEQDTWAYIDKLVRPRLRLLGGNKYDTEIPVDIDAMTELVITVEKERLDALMDEPYLSNLQMLDFTATLS